jgi:hypothetical protein
MQIIHLMEKKHIKASRRSYLYPSCSNEIIFKKHIYIYIKQINN